ncbi:MAG TPA: MarR family winged helix-turn-helix transcriptional regulator [Solirubrobacteraceae bacterium]|nr:MarR family winged helix-turn-helix transcriptional regulator [Solirubrobacteraceae bacterium]
MAVDPSAGAEEHVGFLLRLAYQRASANATEAIRASGLTPMQFQTLRRLSQRGRITQNELGRSVGMPPANIHSIVQRLRASELVTITPSPGDRRLTFIELTVLGRRTLQHATPAADAANALTLAVLTETEQNELMASLRKLAGASATDHLNQAARPATGGNGAAGPRQQSA